ncbi:hypothetical protein FCR2A7T_23130 [Flavobacterium cauense R2A-7]|nr:hypothetical protein FCR2A7T_23130 [Flavobacterium cauense R2A-7]
MASFTERGRSVNRSVINVGVFFEILFIFGLIDVFGIYEVRIFIPESLRYD